MNVLSKFHQNRASLVTNYYFLVLCITADFSKSETNVSHLGPQELRLFSSFPAFKDRTCLFRLVRLVRQDRQVRQALHLARFRSRASSISSDRIRESYRNRLRSHNHRNEKEERSPSFISVRLS